MSPISKPEATGKRVIASILLAVPLLAGVGVAATSDTQIASTWTNSEESQGAPAAVAMPDLSEVRRAVGNANAQSSMLQNGTKQLVDGTEKLKTGSQALGDGVHEARDGSQQLANGMTEIQAGTAQLGDGATKVADGVEVAVNQMVGLEAARGQILTAIEDAQSDVENSVDPRAAEMKQRLAEFHARVEAAALDEGTKAQLEELRSGSREVANQLAVPGYSYHDGIYSATKGSKDLASGLNRLSGGVDEATSGVDQLDEGVKKIDSMAQDTRAKLAAAQRALPAVTPGTQEAEEAGVSQSLAPLYAFFIAAGIMLAAATRVRDWRGGALAIVALGVLGAVLVAVLGVGMSVGAAIIAGLVGALSAALSAAMTMALMRILGPRIGLGTSFFVLLAQVGIVGWVWNKAATESIASGLEALAALMPLNYPTLALSAVGNQVGGAALWVPLVVMLALIGAAAASLKIVPESRTEDVEKLAM